METEKIITIESFRKTFIDFDRLISAKGYKTGNGNMYQMAVKEFLIWLESQHYNRLDQITTSICGDYYNHLTSRKNERRGGTLSNTSINHHLFGLRLFIDHLWDLGYLSTIVAIAPNHEVLSRDKEVLTQNQIELLFASTSSLMEKALLSLAYGCGLRRQELCDLHVSDIAFHKSKMTVRNGKGNKTREIPMSETVRTHLHNYAVTDRMSNVIKKNKFSPNFFITQQGSPANGNHLNRMLKLIVKRTENLQLIEKEVSLHFLRHCIATHLAENGADMEFIRDFLGHDSIDTSSLYMVRRKRKSKYLI